MRTRTLHAVVERRRRRRAPAVKDTLKFYCCTLQGLLRLKLIIGLILGRLIMLAAILHLQPVDR